MTRTFSLKQVIQKEQAIIKTVLALGIFALFAVVMVLFRMHYSGRITYIFLFWNLFLAWVPLFLALSVLITDRLNILNKGLLLPIAIAWLLFYPNAPYIVTDLVHLKPRIGVPYWYDHVLLSSFIINALLTGFVSLLIIHHYIKKFWGTIIGWLFVASVSFLSGLGIYIGRYLRWNSWDVVNNLKLLVLDIGQQLANPAMHPRTYGVMILFGVFLFLGYVLFVNLVNLDLE